jgi:Putative Ig domain
MRRNTTLRSIASWLLSLTALSGCSWDSDSRSVDNLSAQIRGLSGAGRIANAAPTLAGQPALQAAIDAYYEFTPSGHDADGHSLQFSITNRPDWATFDARTGRLAGTPTTSDTGVYANIVIAASDGRASATLGPFTIAVGAGAAALPGAGSAELLWHAPTQNSDGSPAVDLAGYRIYYGTDPNSLTYSATLNGANNTHYMVTGLHAGTWYFAVAAVTATGAESDLSEIGSKTIG